jgi:KDO2-lipid IV(A) lauroyltransferase
MRRPTAAPAEAGGRGRTKQREGLAERAVDLAARGIIAVALALPYAARVRFAGWLMRRLIGPVAGYRNRALVNLAATWPDRSDAERWAIANKVCDNVGRTLIENYSTVDLLARMADVMPEGPGVPALEEAQAASRPVILVTGHFGNYEAARACLVARGFRVGGLYRPMRNRFFNDHYVRTMQAFGGPVFGQGARGTAGFVRHLRDGGQLVLLFDQHVNRAEDFQFLGRPAATATSAAELALRYGAALIPFYATRLDDGLRFRVELEAPVPPTTPREMTEALTRSLEARVEANPGQWFWIHRRWKPRPRPKVKPAPDVR